MTQNYINTQTGKLFTELLLKTMGIDASNAAQLEANHLEPVTYAYPAYDKALYTIEPKPELTKVAHGYVQEFNVVDRSVESAKEALKERVTSKRWEIETGGIEIDGFEIQTDIADQNRIDSTINGMEAAGMAETPFKGANGWSNITLDGLKQVRVAIVQHVEACFAREYALHQAIDACSTIKELAAVDIEAGWPNKVVG